MKKRLIVNAVNLSSRGGRQILIDCLQALDRDMGGEWHIKAYVHSRDGLPKLNHVETEIIRFRYSNWLGRLWFELFELKSRERGQKIDMLLSLQGSSARLRADQKIIYCHQNLPLAPMPWRTARKQPKIALQRMIYDLVYRFFIGKNNWIIIQQQWSRLCFSRKYGIHKSIVSKPISENQPNSRFRGLAFQEKCLRLLYPCGPYANKNIITLCEAVKLLVQMGVDLQATITISPGENAYSRNLAASVADYPQIFFAGLLDRPALNAAYKSHHLLVFPSLVESWGLPLSEGKAHGIGIVAADLPYAHETIGDYDGVSFFPPEDSAALATLLHDIWTRTRSLGKSTASPTPQPYARNWSELTSILAKIDEIAPPPC
ncbi:glycosyltransferase [Sandaracinobacter sp. RS1-74]|uniref:glycosyltransferase n=1 Tax=Sandaracinobacteroides sayramensis TaxID=2913411 RepID=UPI001EDB2105|nr:glycosyltransferase [Sandaracinobacteroides sayramensis]MCG2841191.1 glycosyltransferase [Sandaracinobacteroides sayramensis]